MDSSQTASASPPSAGESPGAGASLGPQLKGVALRLLIPVALVWGVVAVVAMMTRNETIRSVSVGVGALVTLAAAGLVVWLMRKARQAQGVMSIVAGAQTKEQRKAALAQLEKGFKPNDSTAVFARAQLLMQEDPRQALEALETIDLSKVMAHVADEARGQRAMIHLALGEVPKARDLVDSVSLSRHQDARTRAMLASVIGEAWARSGQAKRARDTLSIIDENDPLLEPLRPQLLRASAFAAAHCNDLKAAKRALKRLAGLDPKLLAGMVDRKSHPVLQREARKLLEQSGVMPRRVQFQRR